MNNFRQMLRKLWWKILSTAPFIQHWMRYEKVIINKPEDMYEMWKGDYKQTGRRVWDRDHRVFYQLLHLSSVEWDMRGFRMNRHMPGTLRETMKNYRSPYRIQIVYLSNAVSHVTTWSLKMWNDSFLRWEHLCNVFCYSHFKLVVRIYAWQWDQTANHDGTFHISKSEVQKWIWSKNGKIWIHIWLRTKSGTLWTRIWCFSSRSKTTKSPVAIQL
jgi:hypothetical protein